MVLQRILPAQLKIELRRACSLAVRFRDPPRSPAPRNSRPCYGGPKSGKPRRFERQRIMPPPELVVVFVDGRRRAVSGTGTGPCERRSQCWVVSRPRLLHLRALKFSKYCLMLSMFNSFQCIEFGFAVPPLPFERRVPQASLAATSWRSRAMAAGADSLYDGALGAAALHT